MKFNYLFLCSFSLSFASLIKKQKRYHQPFSLTLLLISHPNYTVFCFFFLNQMDEEIEAISEEAVSVRLGGGM